MSLKIDVESSSDDAIGAFHASMKHSKISYTRDFLLSLSELDVCKKLPSGLDQSMLSDLEDASHGLQDHQRIPGSFSGQSYRRTEYGSSPPTRSDASNYSRGTYGRWDNRSSGRNERDSDSQSELDSDSGRRFGNQSRWSGHSHEHDGLLGSGSFPRPSGYAAGVSASKVRSIDHYPLSRSNEPYHPPRPYKAVPHLRRDTKDLLNDETFGSTECTSQDRAEEERRRRESFELMRKEQQKTLQEKQKLNPDKYTDDPISDITELQEDNKNGKKVSNKSNELDESVTQQISNKDSSKSFFPNAGSRPLVPPGFKSAILESNPSSRSLTHSHSAEIGGSEIGDSLSRTKAIVLNGAFQEERQLVQKIGFREQQLESLSIHTPSSHMKEQIVDSSSDLGLSMELGVNNDLYKTSVLSEASETQNGCETVELETKKVTGQEITGNFKQDRPESILQKLFCSGGSSGFVEHHDTEQDTRSPNTVQSSKFARWFLEDENKPPDSPPGRPSDLLSLIVGGEKKGASQASDLKSTKHIPSDLPFLRAERSSTSNVTCSAIGITEQFYNSGKQEAIPGILTCEDLEQTILSEYSETSLVQDSGVPGAKAEELKAHVDNRASQHLLSLLQKGTGLNDTAQYQNLDRVLSEEPHVSEGAIVGSALDNSKEEKVEYIHHSGKTLTLETLFGSAFMKELQSVEAPVSVQRGPIGSARIDISDRHGFSAGHMGDGLFPTSAVGIASNKGNHDSNLLQSSQMQQPRSDKPENWSDANASPVEVVPLKHRNDTGSLPGGFDVAVDIQLPEEESLIGVGDPVNTRNSILMSAGNSTKGELPYSIKPVDIAEKLAALNAIFKDELPMAAQEGLPVAHGHYDPLGPEIPFRNLHAQPSSSQLHPPQMNHGRPIFHPLDLQPTHVSPRMSFMAPDGIIRHDTPANHQFPANMLRPPFHHNTGPTGFDLPFHHPMSQRMQMQMQMPGNFHPPHPLQEFPKGGPLPPHPSNRATGLLQELNPMQGFPIGQQHPNFGGLGSQSQAPEVNDGSNHSEAFQRLLEMEHRANSKRAHPFAAPSHSQGMYGHELDMGFRFR